jgi:hypothetical protein
MMRPLTLLLSALLLLSGCATVPTPETRVSELLLHKPISVPEERARVFLQDGRVVQGFNEFIPHCALEIRHLYGPPRTIPAGRYPVTRVQPVVTEVVFAAPRQRVAELGVGISGGHFIGVGDYNESPPEIFEGYHYWLEDRANVGLMRLTCYGARGMPSEVEPPTLAELARVLGGLGQLTTLK